MEFERRERFARHIDLTALVDIVFHLMVFFMVTTTFVVSESMELTLPSNGGNTSVATPAQFTRIIVAPGGNITVDNNPINTEGLQNLLVERIGSDGDTKIVIYTTPGVSVQELVSVLDMVYFAGGRNVQVDKVSV
jgi:biopolymer transport protein ExbD